MNLVVADVDHEHDDLFVTLDSEYRIGSVMVDNLHKLLGGIRTEVT